MLVEDGRRLLISNLDLTRMTEIYGQIEPKGKRTIEGQGLLSRPSLQLFSLFPDAYVDFKVRTAVRMSATFPYITPTTNLPTDLPYRVVDAGYFDNYGVDVAANWIYRHRAWLADHTSGVALIQIRDGLGERRRRELVLAEDAPYRGWGRSLDFALSPLEGFDSARQAVNSFRNDEAIALLSDWFDDLRGVSFFTTFIFENPAEVALSWYLMRKEKSDILQGMRRSEDSLAALKGESPAKADSIRSNAKRLNLLKDWWKTNPTPPLTKHTGKL